MQRSIRDLFESLYSKKPENLDTYDLLKLTQEDIYIHLVIVSIASSKIEAVIKESLNKEKHRPRCIHYGILSSL